MKHTSATSPRCSPQGRSERDWLKASWRSGLLSDLEIIEMSWVDVKRGTRVRMTWRVTVDSPCLPWNTEDRTTNKQKRPCSYYIPIMMIAANRSSISLSGFCRARSSVSPCPSRFLNTLFVSVTTAAALNTARSWAIWYSGRACKRQTNVNSYEGQAGSDNLPAGQGTLCLSWAAHQVSKEHK